MLVACGVVETALWLGGWNVRLQSEWVLTNSAVVLDPDLIMARRPLLAPAFMAPAPPPLILTIGDSFTEGFPVHSDDAYPSALGRILAQRGVAVTVRNAGMGDTGPDQQLRFFQGRLLPKLRPDVVVWQLYANDLWDNVLKAVYRMDGDRLEPLDATWHWMALRQRLFDWTPLPGGVKRRSRAFRLLLRAFEPMGRPGIQDELITTALAKLELELRTFRQLAAAHGFVPYVLLVPPQSLYLRGRDPGFDDAWYVVGHERLAKLLQGWPELIDGSLGLANAGRCFDARRDPAELGSRHLNERGYARLALLVARRLLHDDALTSRAVR